MATITEAFLNGQLVPVDKALGLKRASSVPLPFLCPECRQLVRPHAASGPRARGNSPAHFEHQPRNPNCSLSHRKRVEAGKADPGELADERAIKQLLKTVPDKTQCEVLVQARLGQGRFRKAVLKVETSCRLTGISDSRFLRASHIKPWADSSNDERLDEENGLMLAPHVDHLFDKGFLTFEDDGQVRWSKEVPAGIRDAYGLSSLASPPRPLRARQRAFMDHHRKRVFERWGAKKL